MITLEKLHQRKAKMSDRTVDAITSCTSAEESNRKILDFLIIKIKQDQHFLKFCNIIEALVKVDMKAVVQALRDGKLICIAICVPCICN